MSTLVAIHQPNVFPWLGYFDKLARSDIFVVLDHVQFPKKGGNWTNRVKFLVAREPRFVSLPIRRDVHGVRQLNEVLTSPQVDWREDIVKTLRTNYGRTAHFAEVFAVAEPLIRNPCENLAEYNVFAIRCLAGRMGIDTTKLVLSSSLGVTGLGTDLLVGLVQAVGGQSYLNGGGSAGYLEPAKFPAAGLELVQQSFEHPIYAQAGAAEFVSGLSCLDALFHCGFAEVAGWLSGRIPPAGRLRNQAA